MDEQLPPPPYSVHDPSPQPSSTAPTEPRNRSIFVSGAAYFEMRPPPLQRPAHVLRFRLASFPDTTADHLPMPEPKQSLVDRHVTPHDWMTFVNHLMPYETTRRHPREKGGGKGAQTNTSVDQDTHPTESERRHNAKATVDEWNQGFFLPRGVRISVLFGRTTPQPSSVPDNPISSRSAAVRDPRRSISPSSPVQSTRPSGTDHKSGKKTNRDPELGKALYRAVEKQEVKTAQVLLEAGADPDARPSWETPTIVQAVKKGNVQLLEMLLKYGPDIDAHAPGDGTALYTAVSKGKTDMVKLLSKYKADPIKRPNGQEPALYKAVSKQYDDIVDLLLQQSTIKIDDNPPGGTTAMYLAAKKGNTELVRRLLTAGAKVDARPMGYNTAMFESAKRGDYDVCRVLLEHGAQVDARTTGGNTALWNIVGKKDERLIRLLLDYGACIHAKACGGETVMERAVKKGRHDMVELLLQYRV
ncbi:MAG: hypothetical protein LQ350_007896 [Teloschistes chrysophthalmus]|nr:MAG: hypothetical protein LQ350_007896 [Niorma chrysophthalma]